MPACSSFRGPLPGGLQVQISNGTETPDESADMVSTRGSSTACPNRQLSSGDRYN